MLSVALPGGTWYYVDSGPTDGALLCFLHGFTGCSQNWNGIFELLKNRFRCVAPDLPGHGRTQLSPAQPEFTMESVARDLSEFIGSFDAGGKILVGYSMGGRLALFTAVQYPSVCDRLVLEGASPGIAAIAERAHRQQEDQALADFIEREGLAAFVDQWCKNPVLLTQTGLPPEKQERIRTQRLNNTTAGLAASLRGMGTGVQPSVHARLSELLIPTLLITGEKDTKFTRIAEDIKSRLTIARHEIVTAAGHNVHLENPARYLEVLLSFVEQ